MNWGAIVTLVLSVLDQAVKAGPIIFKTAEDMKPFLLELFNGLLGRQPTEDERTMLEQHIDQLSAQLQTPLPSIQDDDI